MIVYKVVRRKEGRYVSCRASGWGSWHNIPVGQFCYTYSKDQNTVDKERGLFCFRALPQARLFSEPVERIFSAEAEGVRSIKYHSAEVDDILIWWTKKREHKRIREMSLPVPEGTCLASHILLLEEVGR